jgi:hypothetical protein
MAHIVFEKIGNTWARLVRQGLTLRLGGFAWATEPTDAVPLGQLQSLIIGGSTAYNFDTITSIGFISEGSTTVFDEGKLLEFNIIVDRFSCASEIIVEVTDVSGYFGGDQTFTIPTNSSAAKFNLSAEAVIPDGTYEVIVTTIGCNTQTKSYFFQFGSGSGSGSGSGGGGGSLTLFPTSPFAINGTITQNSPTVWTVDPTSSIIATTNELGLINISGGTWTIFVNATPNEYTVKYAIAPSIALINGVVPVVSSSSIVNSLVPPNITDFSGTVGSGTITF